MTGTGKTAEVEFEKIYNLSVEEIPTARPNQKNLSDLIYKDQFSNGTFNVIMSFSGQHDWDNHGRKSEMLVLGNIRL
jgi:hypothetical protein